MTNIDITYTTNKRDSNGKSDFTKGVEVVAENQSAVDETWEPGWGETK